MELLNDDLYRWEIKLFEFDSASQLAKDLQAYKKKHGEVCLFLFKYSFISAEFSLGLCHFEILFPTGLPPHCSFSARCESKARWSLCTDVSTSRFTYLLLDLQWGSLHVNTDAGMGTWHHS